MTDVAFQPPPILPSGDRESIQTAARLLRDGEVVAIPTDTVYGLAASTLRPESVRRVFEIKGRPAAARVPVLFATAADLPLLVEEVPRVAWTLIDRFWPGPLTVVLPARPSVPSIITGGGRTVAVRVPAGRVCLELLQMLAEPVIGTSANISGRPPAKTAADVARELGNGPAAVLEDDAGIRTGIASTVVEIVDGAPVVHRVGAVTLDQLRQAAGMRVHLRTELT
jgi:L-threonylcarbamoyladenylate synthase